MLIDEAQLLSADNGSTLNKTFWANMKGLQQASKLRRSVRVVLFAVYSDSPSGLPAAGYVSHPMTFDAVVTFRTLETIQQALAAEVQAGAAGEQQAAGQQQTADVK